MASPYPPFGPLVCVVGFHHHRGPEIESWYGVPPDTDPAVDNDWSYLPFMALADGAHASTEDFSYFTLTRKIQDTPRTSNVSSQSATQQSHTSSSVPQLPKDIIPASTSPEILAPKPVNPARESLDAQPGTETTPSVSRSTTPLPARARYGAGASVFAMSCTRQLDARELLRRPDDVTRSTVQKSVVLLVGSRPGRFAGWRDKLGAVTRAWFLQRDFEDREILKQFQESLVESEKNNEDEPDHFLGISLRQFVYDFRQQALVLFKCALLQPKMLFFGAKCEKICMIQFALISLIPGLIRHLEDCADPALDTYAAQAFTPTSLRTSDRNSLMEYMGLPLQIFGKGGFFGPYTPLQQLDLLGDINTNSYIIGSTNTLLLQQREGGPEVVCDVDERQLTIYNQSLRTVLNLTAADRRWIDGIHQTILSTWDPENPSLPTDHGYLGSEDFIRFQFEEYVLALLSATKYQHYFHAVPHRRRDISSFPEIEGDPTNDFGDAWLDMWKATPNYALWNKYTDSHLFDIVDPKHPTAGGLSVDDLQRRFAQQVSDLHLDTRVAIGREVLGKHIATGQKKVSNAFSSLWAEIEARRAAAKERSDASGSEDTMQQHNQTQAAYMEAASVRASQASAVASAAGQRATAYLSGWGAWASEKRKGWSRATSTADLKEKAAQSAVSPVPELKPGRNEKGLTVATDGESKYGDVKTPEGAQTLWEAGNGSPVDSRADANSPSVAGSFASPRRLKRMSTRLSNKSPKSKERIIDGIGRIDA